MNCKGFSFVEVLVTSVIIMLSVTGYTSLQAQYMRSDTNMNLRYMAVQLGKEKLDDLRQFTRVFASPGEYAFNDLINNMGGSLPAGDVEIKLSKDEQNVHIFTRNWSVIDEYYIDTDNDGSSDSWVRSGEANLTNPLPGNAALKMVTVTIGWLDRSGNEQAINLSGSIAPIKLGNSYQAKTESDNVIISPQ